MTARRHLCTLVSAGATVGLVLLTPGFFDDRHSPSSGLLSNDLGVVVSGVGLVVSGVALTAARRVGRHNRGGLWWLFATLQLMLLGIDAVLAAALGVASDG